jgi:hypothetical protein
MTQREGRETAIFSTHSMQVPTSTAGPAAGTHGKVPKLGLDHQGGPIAAALQQLIDSV